MRHINEAGLELIKEFEGLRLKAYRCPAGVLTIGYGSTSGVKEGMEITKERAEELLRMDCVVAEACIESKVARNLSDNAFSALVCFVFNLGCGAFAKSGLLRKINAGDMTGAANEFGRWVNAGGKPLDGLIRRRAAEKKLFVTPT